MGVLRDGPAGAPRPKLKWIAGKQYTCTHSASPAYKVGDVVECYTNDKGWKCIKGRDGLEDICSMLVSAFRENSA